MFRLTRFLKKSNLAKSYVKFYCKFDLLLEQSVEIFGGFLALFYLSIIYARKVIHEFLLIRRSYHFQ